MPRTRLVVIVWLLGCLLLLGAWIHSLVQTTTLQGVFLKRSFLVELSILGGSFECSWSTVYGKGPNRVQLNERAPPRYRWGRFQFHRYQSGSPPFAMARTVIQVPLGFLLILYALVCGIFFRRYHRRAQLED